MSEPVVLLGCGEVGPIHEPMAQYSELVRNTLAALIGTHLRPNRKILVVPEVPGTHREF
jgi:hypothetical protein